MSHRNSNNNNNHGRSVRFADEDEFEENYFDEEEFFDGAGNAEANEDEEDEDEQHDKGNEDSSANGSGVRRQIEQQQQSGEDEEVVVEEEDDNNHNNASPAAVARLPREQQQQQQLQTVHPPALQQQQPSSHLSSLLCPNCGSRKIEHEFASGSTVCTECGVVVEESAIVSSVEFVEGAGGASSMVGQFVSATSSKAYTGGPGGGGGRGGGRYGFSRDSRETTLANGRRRIQEVASRLRLGNIYVDAAHRLFTIAVEKNFVQGRRTTHVVAACLYIACRQEKSQHMLIDFSDALQVNVYTLGTCFLKFRRLLGLKLEIIDPALYVYRFAAHLNLDDKANAVALTALRLVGRMKRDWIVAGRRPAGICAAALLIAARAHGFSRQHQDVTRILRVCGLTVNTRVREFELTPSANLTLEQFNAVELETEADPPVFTRNKIREARAKAIQEQNIELLTSGALDDPMGGKRAHKWRQPRKSNDRKAQFEDLYQSLEKELASDSKTAAIAVATTTTIDASTETVVAAAETSPDKDGKQPHKQQLVPVANAQLAPIAPSWVQAYPRSRYGRAIILPDHATAEERQESNIPVEAKLNFSEWKDHLPDSISHDLDGIFCSEEEVAQKEAIFNSLNQNYLEQEQRKATARQGAETVTNDQDDDDAAQAEGHARYLQSASQFRNRKRRGADATTTTTTEEALLAALAKRKVSRKINYDAMSAIFDEDGSFSTDHMDESTGQQEMDPTFAML